MENLLIDITSNAKWDRLLPFPDEYRITSQSNTPHTREEYEEYMSALRLNIPSAVAYATNINLDIVKHNQNSLHSTVTEFEFQYSYLDNYKKNIKYQNRWYLFHGSPLGNWHSILRSGIKNMSGTRFMTTGQAYGPGVYATNDIRIASGYGISTSGSYYVAVIELLVDPVQFLKTPGIYVIPDDTILFPRYLLVLTRSPNFGGQEILDFYKKLREGLIKPNTKLKRLASDRAPILHHFIEEVSPTCWLLYIKYTLFRCYLVSYPFKAPVLQLCNKLRNPNQHFDESGCYISYPYSEWSLNNNIKDLIEHVIQNTNLADNGKEEYEEL
jgi:hypothetical protein